MLPCSVQWARNSFALNSVVQVAQVTLAMTQKGEQSAADRRAIMLLFNETTNCQKLATEAGAMHREQQQKALVNCHRHNVRAQ